MGYLTKYYNMGYLTKYGNLQKYYSKSRYDWISLKFQMINSRSYISQQYPLVCITGW